jgi:pantetheine-phosphate adenylyltransferase
MKRAVFPGSFDPFTTAHREIVRNAYPFFDITILICSNGNKNSGMFNINERKEMIQNAIGKSDTVRVDVCNGLLTDYCKWFDIEYVIRGIQYKNVAEELDLAHIYYEDQRLETVFFPTYKPELEHVSSTRVREYIKYNGFWESCVPQDNINFIQTWIQRH